MRASATPSFARREAGFSFPSGREAGFSFPSGREAGFSFIELLVALAILAFAFSYAVIHLDGASAPARLAAAGRQIGSNIEFLHGHAVQATRPMLMEIDLETSQYRSIRPPRRSEEATAEGEEDEIIQTEWVALPRLIRIEGVQLGASDADLETTGLLRIEFGELGEITPNGFVIRLISDEIGDPELGAFSVEVNGLTGEVGYIPGRAPFDQVIEDRDF